MNRGNNPGTAECSRLLRRCCYLGMFVQAMVINLTPLFFIPLRARYDLDFEQLGRLVLISFFTQMVVDLACTWAVDRFGRIKALTVWGQVCAGGGLVLFAAGGWLFPSDPYTGLVVGTVIFSVGCGLLEVLLSPIVQAIPGSRKDREMALLHAFYPIGKVAVIAVTGFLLWVFGPGSWVWITLAWAAVPLANAFAFTKVDLPAMPRHESRLRTRVMARTGLFWISMAAMLCAGASEVTFGQWISAFAQSALGFGQAMADWVGFGLFGLMMVAGRLWFGFNGHGNRLHRVMILGALLSAGCYVVAGLSPWPPVSLLACILSGLTVSMLWPGIISLGAGAFPRAGVSLFALMAAFGDAGAGLGPWAVGVVADGVAKRLPGSLSALTANAGWSAESAGLRIALALGSLAPLLLAVLLLWLRKSNRDSGSLLAATQT